MSLNLNDLTLIVPFKIDSEDRRNNLRNCINFFSKTGCQFIAMEGIVRSPTETEFDPSHKVLHQVVLMDEGESFHKTALINLGLGDVLTEFFGILDCDMICQYAQLAAAMLSLRERMTDFVYPYDGRFVEVPRDLVPAFLDGSIKGPTDFRVLNANSCGGLIMGLTEAYRSAGGENQNFKAWGPEDMERHNRLITLGHRIARINGPIFHMEHKRGPDSNDTNPFFEDNNKEYKRITLMDSASLRKEVDSWEWKQDL